MEVWKKINGYNGRYEISNFGNVKSNIYKKPRNLKLIKMKIGYYRVSLQYGKIVKPNYVHRLVAEHFLNKKENHECVNHKDGNKLNNHVDNLEWCTKAENNKHAWDLDLNSKEKRCKLDRFDVDRVRGLFALGLTGNRIAKILKLPKTPVYWIIQGKTWQWYSLTK